MKENGSGHGGKKIKIGTQMEERVFRRLKMASARARRPLADLIQEDGDPVSEIFARVERTFEIPRMVRAVNPQQVDEANLWLRRER